MPEPDFKIRTEPMAIGRRGTASKRRKISPILLLVSAAICAAIAITIFIAAGFSKSNKTRPEQATAPSNAAKALPPSTPPEVEDPQAEEVVDDPKGKLLWASPTSGSAMSLEYVPAGSQCLIHVRPADLVAHSEGKRILAALGPWGQRTVERLESLIGRPLEEVDALLAAIVVDDRGKLDASLRVGFTAPLSDEKLAGQLQQAQQHRHGDAPYYLVEDRAYFVQRKTSSDATTDNWLIVCPQSLAFELIESQGEPPPLVRDIERLVESSDRDRHFTAIIAPKFLEAGGNELLVNTAAPLHDAIRGLFQAEATAVLLSAHLGDDFFAELRGTPTLNVPARRLAAKLRERIAAAPDAIEESILAEPWHPYGRKVVARLPAMLRALARYSRASDENQQAVVRAYLPASAGHNLLMAAELLFTQPRADEIANVTASEGAARPAATIDEQLERNTSLAFSKETLERALELLSEDIGVEIAINGADLQLEGITKNQSLAIEMRDRPAREILLKILLQANPDRTATGPMDAKQKLIYIVDEGDSNAPGRITVTTRAAAERRGDPVPAEFLLKNR